MKQNNLKHQALSTLITKPDQLWTDWLNRAVPSKQRAQLEYALLNKMDAPPGEHLDRWYSFQWGLGVDGQWLIFWKATLSPDDFRDVALVSGLQGVWVRLSCNLTLRNRI
ncbi:hypothetical protein N9H39_02945 [Gammaproteobacteria bacterium]|nr:hypothetical protein [Gammaproteobacteria bacterium]